MSGNSSLDQDAGGQRVMIVDAGIDTAKAVAEALAGMPGATMFMVGDDPHVRIIDEAVDMPRLAMFDALLAIEPVRRRDRMGFYHEPRPQPRTDRGRVSRQTFDGLAGDVTHIDTPKPISKRKARRLRGKAQA